MNNAISFEAYRVARSDQPRARLSANEVADSLTMLLWEGAENAGKETDVTYQRGELGSAPEAPAISIEIVTDTGTVCILEDHHSRFWISCWVGSRTVGAAYRITDAMAPESWVERGLAALVGTPDEILPIECARRH